MSAGEVTELLPPVIMDGQFRPVSPSNNNGVQTRDDRESGELSTKRENEKYTYHIEENLEEEAFEEKEQRNPNKFSSCREKGRHILHSKHALRTIVALCIIDTIMVMVELVLDNTAVRHDIVDKYGLLGGGCAELQNKTASPSRHRRAASSGDGESYGSHTVYATVAHYCHYVSVAILCLLTAETLVKIVCFGKRFFKSKLEMFDAFVVIASLIADCILLEGVTHGPPLLSSAIVNVLLPWRVIRVVNSLIIATHDHEHFKLLLVYKAKKRVEDQLDLVAKDLHASRKRTEALEKICRQNGLKTGSVISDDQYGPNEKGEKKNIDDISITFHDSKSKETEPDEPPVTQL